MLMLPGYKGKIFEHGPWSSEKALKLYSAPKTYPGKHTCRTLAEYNASSMHYIDKISAVGKRIPFLAQDKQLQVGFTTELPGVPFV